MTIVQSMLVMSSTMDDVLDHRLHGLQPLRFHFRYRYLYTRTDTASSRLAFSGTRDH